MKLKDRGAAALAERLHAVEDPHLADVSLRQKRLAAAILGEHGRFLPDGHAKLEQMRQRARRAENEVERLRAALITLITEVEHAVERDDLDEAIGAARIALSPDPCGDDSWDARYACTKPKGHPTFGPGLTDHEYHYKRPAALSPEREP